MKIWAHCMFKNEANWLWYSVNSVAPYVDKLLLWDTGSFDNSYEIVKELMKRYGDKIIFRERKQETAEEFTKVRQEMLDETDSDWFIVVDGDEIWWKNSIKKVISSITSITGNTEVVESIVVPTVNLVGDIFHYQDNSTGNYEFGKYKGHYNLRAIKRDIPGLYSQGAHGVWGWADENGKQIQERNTWKFIDAPYLHATNIERSMKDKSVPKRKHKLKYEIGKSFPLDFYYPEVLFEKRPNFVKSPWKVSSKSFRFRAFFETPIRKLKRNFLPKKIGY